MLVNVILTNCEVWLNVKEDYLKTLEAADNELMRKIFNAHSKTACELFFLETAKIPIRLLISKRRLMYLWHLLRRNEEELIKKVYQTQKVKTTNGDWFQMIHYEKEKYNRELLTKLSQNWEIITKLRNYH